VSVSKENESRIVLNGREIEMDPVKYVLGSFSSDFRVAITTDLPVGSGFGVSGASALGTALAANELETGGNTGNELVTIAHCAEVKAKTGLGDVVAQARGGIPIRLAAGAPEFGDIDGVPGMRRIEYLSFGEVPTTDVIGDSGRFASAGTEALAHLTATPTIENLFRTGREFAEATGLLPESIAPIVDDVVSAGGEATMAMLGETVIALDTGLSDVGYDPNVCRVRSPGATLQNQ
jgi:pantoate kinase